MKNLYRTLMMLLISVALQGCMAMGVGPATPSSEPVGIEFLDGGSGVETEASFSYTFSEEIDPSSVSSSNFFLAEGGGSNIAAPFDISPKAGSNAVCNPANAVSSTITIDRGLMTVVLTPTSALSYSTTYTLCILPTILSATTGQPVISAPVSATFSTKDNPTPSVSSNTPANGATSVSVDTTISVVFNTPMDTSTITTDNLTLAPTAGGSAVAGSVSYNSTSWTATFTPSSSLTSQTSYTFTVSANVKSSAGTIMGTASSFSFTTADITAPTISSVSPASGATSVAVNSAVQATFSEEMDSTTITTTTFSLSGGVTGTVAYTSGSKVATFTPSANLTAGTTYTATVTTGVKDSAGNAMAANYSWSFTTTDATAPTVTGKSPASGATNVDKDTTVTATFSEAMDSTTLATASGANSFTLAAGAAVSRSVTYASGTKTATLTPDAALTCETTYTATVSTAAKDANGVALANAETWNFTTERGTLFARTEASGTSGKLDVANSGEQTADGGYVFAGATNSWGAGGADAWVVKLDNTGDVSWEFAYGTASNEQADYIEQTADGGYIVAGTSGNDALVIKLDSSGTVSWSKTYTEGTNIEAAHEVHEQTDGKFIVIGTTSPNNRDIFLLRLDSNGSVNSDEYFSTASQEEGYSVQKRSGADSYVIAGSSGGKIYVGIVSMVGITADKISTNNGSGLSVRQTADGGYIIAGTHRVSGSNYDAWVAKLVTGVSLAVTWERNFGHASDADVIYSVRQLADSSFIATGADRAGSGNEVLLTMALDTSGNITWKKNYTTGNRTVGNEVDQTTDGGYFIAGYDYNSSTFTYRAWPIKTDSSGNIGSSCSAISDASGTESTTSVTFGDVSVSPVTATFVGSDVSLTKTTTSATEATQCCGF